MQDLENKSLNLEGVFGDELKIGDELNKKRTRVTWTGRNESHLAKY